MTRQELTNTRDLQLSGWIREQLPDSSTGFLVSDLDFILWNYKTRNLMLLEVKTRGSMPRKWQSMLFDMIDKMVQYATNNSPQFINITYHGFHVLSFTNTFFNDGKVFYDGKELSEYDIIKILSME
jgi:hypothetical protein